MAEQLSTRMRKIRALSNRQLINRINSLYKRGLNDDDEVGEMIRRRDAGKLKFKAGFDTYELIN
jgi:hypothetical protein